MRVLVTGGTGFVGSHAVESLLAAGHDVRLLARSEAKVASVMGVRGIDIERVEVVYGDMGDVASVEAAVDGCDTCVHSAASVAVTGADNSQVTAINVDGARNVVGTATAAGLDPVIYVSTTGVFVPPVEPLITPDSPLAHPHNAYGRSKVEAERFVRDLQDRGMPITTIYPGGVFGPDQPTVDAAMEGVAGALEKGWPMPKGGVTIVDVRDLAAIVTAALVPGQGPRRFMAGGRFLSWGDFADLCDELTGVRCKRITLPGPAMIALGWALDVAKRIKPFEYPLTRDAAEYMVKMVPTDDDPTWAALGLSPRPTRQTIEDSLRWMATHGHLAPKVAGRLAP